MIDSRQARLARIAAILVVLSACAQAIVDRAPLTGSSKTLSVRGEYSTVALERVDAISMQNGRLVVRGPTTNVTVDLPASADPAKPNRHWALVTETSADNTRTLTFTHDMSLDEFSLDLPAGDAEVHYGVLSDRTGGDVMVLAWGEESRCYWGYVTITRGPARR